MNTMLIAGPILMMLALIFSGIGIAIGGPIMVDGYSSVLASTVSATEVFTDITKATDNTSLVTLAHDVYPADTSSAITSVTSNNTGDSPVVNSVSGASANISGMNDATANRTLTLTYNYNALPQFTSADTVIKASPTLFLLGFVITGAISGMLGITLSGIGAYRMYKGAKG